jgi:hypothetical protein
MRFLGVLFYLALASGVAGCANHPDVGDTTGYTTGDLIEKIQCEAQVAILENDRAEGFDSLHETLARLIANQTLRTGRKLAFDTQIDPYGKKLKVLTDELDNNAKEVNSAKRKLETLKHEILGLQSLKPSELKVLEDRIVGLESDVPKEIKRYTDLRTLNQAIDGERAEAMAALDAFQASHGPPILRKVQNFRQLSALNLLNQSTVTFAFTLDIKEDNNNSAGGSIVWPLAVGTATLAGSAADHRTRQAVRTVTISSNIKQLREKNCNAVDLVQDTRARRLPLTGNVGMTDLVRQYLKLAKLYGPSDLTDTLTFTTDVNGTVNPSINLTPSSGAHIKANINSFAQRLDTHTIIASIAPIQKPEEIANRAQAREAQPASEPQIFILNTIKQ